MFILSEWLLRPLLISILGTTPGRVYDPASGVSQVSVNSYTFVDLSCEGPGKILETQIHILVFLLLGRSRHI